MEEVLLEESESQAKESNQRWKNFRVELKRVSYLAAPMVAVSVSQYLLQVVAMMMAGHLGQLSLSGVAIATSFTNVTGFSLLVGMAGGLETLCGQAYGAEQYQKLGTYTFCGVLSLAGASLPICLLWIFMEKLLILMGQDPEIASIAGRYSILLIPALFGQSVLQPLVRYFQTQGLILPMLFTASVVLCFHIPVCWTLVFKLELGSTGAALSIGLSYWLSVILLGIYMKYSSDCEKTRASFSIDVFFSIKDFYSFAVPSAIMACLEWWSFELLILFSGILPNPELETSVLSICLTTTSLLYFIPYGISVAGSTRVSNELGAGNPEAARVSVLAVIVLAVIEAVLVSIVMFFSRSVLGYVYSNEPKVVVYVAKMTPLLSLSVTMDSLYAVLSGIARGSGWQHLGAYVNLGAYYLVGIPVATLLGFLLHLRGFGLWIGIMSGSFVQATLLGLITSLTNWQKQAVKARERIFKDTATEGGLE